MTGVSSPASELHGRWNCHQGRLDPGRRPAPWGSTSPVSRQSVFAFSLQIRRVPLRIIERRQTMGMGVSLLLIAVGAFLVWSVNATVSGIEILPIGWSRVSVGAIGALLSLI